MFPTFFTPIVTKNLNNKYGNVALLFYCKNKSKVKLPHYTPCR
jgi:hypothetical protein